MNQDKPARGNSPSTHTHIKRILVVDDSLTMRQIIRRMLEGAGYVVVEARNGAEAHQRFQEQSFDLLTLDVDMPGKNGFEVCADLRAEEARLQRALTPVIFITSHDTLVDRQRGFDVGAADFIAKPPQEAEFLARVNRLLRADQRLSGLHVLVVEDSRATRNIISHMLRECGLKVTEAEDGLKALDILKVSGKDLDLVITDYDMPGLDGKELCKRIRTVFGLPWLPVIFLSGMSEMSYVLDMFAAGGTDYLTKPFTREELVARISVHIEFQRLSQQHTRQIQELERLNKLKDGLLAIASHDLRAPLNGIMGYSNLMLMDEELPEHYRDMAEGIRDSGTCLLEMIEDILNLARLQARQDEIELSRCDLAQIADEAVRVLSHMAAPKGILVTHPRGETPQPVWVNGHRNSLLRIINNLTSNAIKFTEPGGMVKVLCQAQPDGSVALVVADTGIGIPPDKVKTLFERFSGSGRMGTAGEQSTGLGMSIVKELATLHGAEIQVESKVGEGTQFILHFPAMALQV